MLRNINLRNKILIFFILASLIPILVLGLFSYMGSEKVIIDKEMEKTLLSIRLIDNNVNTYFNEKRYSAITLCQSNDVMALIEETTGQQINTHLSQVKKDLYLWNHTRGTKAIYLYSKNKYVISNDLSEPYILKDPEIKHNITLLKDEYFYLLGPTVDIANTYCIPLVQPITNPKTKEYIGFVIIYILEQDIADYLMTSQTEKGFLFLLDKNGVIISAEDKNLINKDIDYLIPQGINLNASTGSTITTYNGEKNLVVFLKNRTLDLTYMQITPLSEITVSSDIIRNTTFLICIIILLLTGLLAWFLINSISKPMKKMSHLIDGINQGSIPIRLDFNAKDDLGRIGNALDAMLDQLQVSIRNSFEAQKIRQKAEYDLLLYQIRPHFLYNTLNSIIWLAQGGENEKTIEMASSLSVFYKIAISKGKEYISVEQEFEHVNSYLTIQQIRFNDRISYTIELPEETKSLYVPKLLLQPLIENSIYHGFKNIDICGVIHVSASIECNSLVFRIKDNGNLSEKGIEELNHFISELNNSLVDQHICTDYGIGIRNVNTRVKILFGQDCCYKYYKENGYTIAMICIPIIRDINTNEFWRYNNNA